jgi:ribosome-binding protein aMBF1 (putative translation factor)
LSGSHASPVVLAGPEGGFREKRTSESVEDGLAESRLTGCFKWRDFLHHRPCLCKEDANNAPQRDHHCTETGKGDSRKRKFISAEESFKRWKKDPKYVAAYNALEEEFALASALIKARSEAEMTQEQVAEAMGTTQAVVARLESGKVLPSTRTLERFAKATRTRLRISFEPDRETAR